jgi:uncharacterized protein YbbC (DUF1343 family)
MQVEFGIDVLLDQSPQWKHEVLGLLTNEAATTASGLPGREVLLRHGFSVEQLFSPEHGLDTRGPDGMPMPDGCDVLTGLPVKSLYLHSFAPEKHDLARLDRMIFDVPDVGARFYTYLWSLTYLMEACAAAGKPLVILDRPNPISGNYDLVEGPMLEMANSSFIGRWPIPIRHSCTFGELAHYFKAHFKINVELEVITCRGWKRAMFQPDWNTTFFPPSPAIQQFESAILYPGLCLLEATNVSEGRGTPYPFTCLGAPWMDAQAVARRLYELSIDEVSLDPFEFTPQTGRYAGQICQGLQLAANDPAHFQPVFWGCMVLKIIHDMYPNSFSWEPYPTLANPTGHHHLNRLFGRTNSEQLFVLPMPTFLSEITRLTRVPDWIEEIKQYQLYS